MKNTSRIAVFLVLVLAIGLAACGPATPSPEEALAQTMAVMETYIAQTLQSIKTASAEPPPTAAPTPSPCTDRIDLDGGTVPDGTYFDSGEAFTKTWRLINVGTCTWNTDYALVFHSGDIMGGSVEMLLSDPVPPGETLEASIDLIAPAVDGSYIGYWMLRNAMGETFGWGEDAADPFWVRINVGAEAAFNPTFFAMQRCDGFYPVFKIVNTGDVTFRSVYVHVKDNVTAQIQEGTFDDFDKPIGCLAETYIATLPPGATGYSFAWPGVLADPAGHSMTATLKVCSQTGLSGVCITRSINFTP
jgi:hypothetical protein